MGWGAATHLFWAGISAASLLHTTGQPAGQFGSFDRGGGGMPAFGTGQEGLDDAPLELPGGDDDVSDLLYDGDSDDGAMAEIDVDEGLDSKTRWTRMRTCLNATRTYMERQRETLAATVAQLASQAQPGSKQSMSPEQVENSVVFGMILTCYQSIDAATLELAEQGMDVPKEKAEDTFGKIGGPPPRPSRDQYNLLDRAMREEQARAMQGIDPNAQHVGGVYAIKAPAYQAAYTLFVAAFMLVPGLYALRRFTMSDGRAEGNRGYRERTDKAQRKVAKAEEHVRRVAAKPYWAQK